VSDPHWLDYDEDHSAANMVAGAIPAMGLLGTDMEVGDIAISVA
jgi:hypothetical protein